MGCRTNANEYYARIAQRQAQYNRQISDTIEGNVVRKKQPEPQQMVKLKRRKQNTSDAALAKAVRRQKARIALLAVIGGMIFISLCAVMMSTVETASILAREVEKKEAELNSLIVANDAREYDIGNSVDLNYVIEVATRDLGMVRSNLSQVVKFRTRDSEYLQQVARVPVN